MLKRSPLLMVILFLLSGALSACRRALDLGLRPGDFLRNSAALRLAAHLFEPLFNLGLTCELLGRREEALRWYEGARAVRAGLVPPGG